MRPSSTTHHSDNGPGDESGDGDGGPDNRNGPNDRGGPDDDGPGDGPDDDGPNEERPDEPDGDGWAAEGGCSVADDPAGQRGLVGAGVELRVRLSTLLGRDDYPGELAGWGPLHAELTRDLATRMGRGQWRFAITDEHGQLLHCGITQARPTGSPTPGDQKLIFGRL